MNVLVEDLVQDSGEPHTAKSADISNELAGGVKGRNGTGIFQKDIRQ